MQHRSIKDLSVSVVGMGCNQLGVACDEQGAAALVHEAIDAGINYFDVADEYGRRYFDPTDPSWGVAEQYLGRALHGKRDRVVIATKFGVRPPTQPELGGASAAWIARAVDESLSRLETDYIDLYQLHIPDPTVPIAETLGALHDLVRVGKVRVIGCSNLSATELQDADDAASELGLEKFASLQTALNIFSRSALNDLMPACERLGMALIPYYPLANGVLTGKYGRGRPLPTGTRLVEQIDDATREKILSDRTFARLEVLETYANERGHTVLELAFAWLLAYPAVATVIAGVARPGQASANAAAVGWQLGPNDADEIIRLVTTAT
ncbi:MAG TPA: aldo/keto reductase [Acidimicrobiales bacterium]|nr:aldo/keto reductase [Acidimicrobiales bacterium]